MVILKIFHSNLKNPMSYCRTTLFEYQSEQDADELVAKYQANAPTNFPNAEILLCTRTGSTTAVMTSLYSSKEMADQAMAARKPLLDDVKAKIKSMGTHEGEAF